MRQIKNRTRHGTDGLEPPFEAGLALVDTQHHALVDMVNLAAPHLARNDEVAKRAVVPLLNNLTHYAVVHCRDEELLIAQHQLAPEYQVHHQQTHQAFVDEVTQMRRQYEQDGSLSGTDLLRFLGNWLSFHILVEDQRMAAQIREIAAGQSAQAAFEHVSQPQDGGHAVYNSSLLDLFTLLTERNRKLSLVNEEVHRVKAAIERANLSLEARVQQRTHDLAALRQRTDVDYLREDIPGLLAESKAGLARVTRIVAYLRDFARADDGHWATADLNQAFESALNIAGNAINHKASIFRQLEPLPMVMCDLAQITQVLVNLLLNAAQAWACRWAGKSSRTTTVSSRCKVRRVRAAHFASRCQNNLPAREHRQLATCSGYASPLQTPESTPCLNQQK